MTRTIDVSQDVPGCVDGGIRERPPVDIGGGGRRRRVVGTTSDAGERG